MKLLLAGGSGFVGSMIVPFLKTDHTIRVLDVTPPQDDSLEFVEGSVLDPAAVERAMAGVEGVVYSVMGRNPDGSYCFRDIDLSYDLNAKGLHHVLHAAVAAGVRRAVYAGTVSVHREGRDAVFASEDMPFDSPTVYGLTKGMGERVCEYFARVHGLAVVSLRLFMPVTREAWHREYPTKGPCKWTAAPDVARAISLAATVPLSGFHAVFISGDWQGTVVNCTRAKELLDWEPMERPGGMGDTM